MGQQSPVRFHRLDEAASPTLTLARELAKGIRHIGKRTRVFAVADLVATFKNTPCNDNIFADRLGPPADFTQYRGAIQRESALGDQGPLVHALDAFDGGDAVEVIPFLHSCDEVLARIAYEHSAGHRCGIGTGPKVAANQVA